MNITLALILLVAGLAVLVKSADVLVSGAVALAKQLGVSSLVIGLTIVAMGTSAPEVAFILTYGQNQLLRIPHRSIGRGGRLAGCCVFYRCILISSFGLWDQK